MNRKQFTDRHRCFNPAMTHAPWTCEICIGAMLLFRVHEIWPSLIEMDDWPEAQAVLGDIQEYLYGPS